MQEILIQDNGKIILARVLLQFDLVTLKYPKTGVWCYLLDTPDGIIVYDPGPKYKGLLNFFRKTSGETHNTEKIFSALNTFFPNKKVTQIICSHYHYDHSENAPELQSQAYTLFGYLPPIRLHKNDLQRKKFLSIFPTSLECIFKEAGFTTWILGEPVQDEEVLPGGIFKYLHTPGHTSGHIALRSDHYKVIITGWVTRIPNPIVRCCMDWFINEDPNVFPDTRKKEIQEGFTYYFHHPEVTSFLEN
jgi:glyoxylase-like metal-dependent hydrolase (beta-lactamase superfamily II)